MRYAIVSTEPGPTFLGFLRTLANADDLVCVFTSACDDETVRSLRSALPHVIFTGRLTIRGALGLVAEIKWAGCEAVIVNGPSTRNYALLAPILRIRRMPVVMWTQEWLGLQVSIKRRLATPTLLLLSRLATVVLAQGERSAALSTRLGVRPERIRMLGLGAEIAGSQPGPSRESDRILFVGRLLRVKGVHILLDALANLSSRGFDVRLTIVGDGPERDNLQTLADRLGLRERVVFAGRVPHARLSEYYASATVFVLPSIYDWSGKEQLEMWGYVLFEAAHFALPLVVTDAVGAATDLIEDGRNGIIVPWGDSRALESALERLFSDPELRRKVGEAAAERAHHFDYGPAAERLRGAVQDAVRLKAD